MSDLRTAALRALEALEWNLAVIEDFGDTEQLHRQHKAITALRAAQSIIQPEIKDDKPFSHFRAEPFGWTDCAPTDEGAIPLYERPQGKLLPWKGLTEEEHTYYKACGFVGVKAVEEKLRARNSTLACHQGEEGK
jgi:hypothetical protein